MPVCKVETNVPSSQIPKELHNKLINFLAELLSKPVDWVMVGITGDMALKRGLEDQPFVLINIHSIGSFSERTNPTLKEPIFEFFKTEWPAIPQDRIVIFLHEVKSHQLLYK